MKEKMSKAEKIISKLESELIMKDSCTFVYFLSKDSNIDGFCNSLKEKVKNCDILMECICVEED